MKITGFALVLFLLAAIFSNVAGAQDVVKLENNTIVPVQDCGCEATNNAIPYVTENFNFSWKVFVVPSEYDTMVDVKGSVSAKNSGSFAYAVIVDGNPQKYVTHLSNPDSRYGVDAAHWTSGNCGDQASFARSVADYALNSGDSVELAFPNNFEERKGTATITIQVTDMTSGEVFTCHRVVNLETLEVTTPA